MRHWTPGKSHPTKPASVTELKFGRCACVAQWGLSHAERMRRRNGGGRRCGSWFRTVAMCGPLVLVLGLAYAYMHVIADHHEQQVQRNSILRGAIGSGGIGETLTNSLLQSSSSPSPPMPPQPMAESIFVVVDSPLRPSSSAANIFAVAASLIFRTRC